MAVKIKKRGLPDKIPIDMTPMIDIVFQLLSFFCMTLRVSEAEGDFNIKMPLAAPRAGAPDPNLVPPIKIRLRADPATGNLVELVINESAGGINFSGANRWANLNKHIRDNVGEGSMAAASEVELDCDYALKYEYVIEAITAVSGRVTPTGEVVKLVEKIKFSPPRQETP